MTRYAVYFAPEAESPLWRFGSSVIGYDASTGQDMPFLATAGLAGDAWHTLTEDPRRYGFHATLKAPFELAEGADHTRLINDMAQLAQTLAPVTLEGLEVAEIGHFVALVPSRASNELQATATTIVEGLDHLRAPLSASDRARRLKTPLTERQIEYLDRYGYPYVREEFRFHMTLTGSIAESGLRAEVRAALAEAYMATVPAGPVVIDALAVFCQERRDGRFRIIARSPVTGRRSPPTP